MPEGDLLVEDMQFEWQGLLLGAHTDYHLERADGLDLLDMRSYDSPRAGDHGVVSGRDLFAGRTIEVEFKVYAFAADATVSRLDELKARFDTQSSELPLAFRLPGVGKRVAFARPRRLAYTIPGRVRAVQAVAQWFCPDPRLYSVDEHGLYANLPLPSEGRAYNRSAPREYGLLGSGGEVYPENAGDVATFPTLTITGPVTDPVTRREDDGREMRFDIALGPADVLVVDTQFRTVTLNGSTSRYSALLPQSEWIDLPPGRSTVSWTASSYDPAAELGVAWRDAYL